MKEDGAGESRPISVKERIKFFQSLGKSEQKKAPIQRTNTNPTRNIFQRKFIRSPFERGSAEVTSKSREKKEPKDLQEIKTGQVGSLVSFFSQKISQKEQERRSKAEFAQKKRVNSSAHQYDISEYAKYDTSSSFNVDRSFQSSPGVDFRAFHHSYMNSPPHGRLNLSSTQFNLNNHNQSLSRSPPPNSHNLSTSPNALNFSYDQGLKYHSSFTGGYQGTCDYASQSYLSDLQRQSQNANLSLGYRASADEYADQPSKREEEDISGKSYQHDNQRNVEVGNQYSETDPIQQIINDALVKPEVKDTAKECLDQEFKRLMNQETEEGQSEYTNQDLELMGYIESLLSFDFIPRFVASVCEQALTQQKEKFIIETFLETEINSMIERQVETEVCRVVHEALEEEFEKEKQLKKAEENYQISVNQIAESIITSHLTQQLKLIALDGLEVEQSAVDACEAVYLEALLRVMKEEIGEVAKECIEKERKAECMELDSYRHIEANMFYNSFSKISSDVFKKKKEWDDAAEAVSDRLLGNFILKNLALILQEEKQLHYSCQEVAEPITDKVLRKVLTSSFKDAASQIRCMEGLIREVVFKNLQQIVFEAWTEENRCESSRGSSRSQRYPSRIESSQNFTDMKLKKLRPREVRDDFFELMDEDDEVKLVPQGGQYQDSYFVPGQEDIDSDQNEEAEINDMSRMKTVKFVNFIRVHNSLPLGADFIDVLCVNCYECIKISDVDSHSATCQKPKEERTSKEMVERSLVQINDRVFKLIKSINGRLFEVKQAKSAGRMELNQVEYYEYEESLQELLSLGNEVFIKNSRLIELRLISTKLHTMLLSLVLQRSYYFSLKVFVERLCQLLSVKMQIIEKMQREEDHICFNHESIQNPFLNEMLMEEEIKEIDRTIEEEQLNLVHVNVIKNKVLNDFMRKSLNKRRKNVSEINSDVGGFSHRAQSVYSSASLTGQEVFG